LKFDGYWLLVDASGIHNLYPRMSAMLRGVFRKKEASAAPALSEETKIFVGLYGVLVLMFSALLIALITVSTYRTALGYPAKLATAAQSFSQAIAVHSVTGAFKTIGSLAVDSFWFLIVGTFVFDFARKTMKLWAKA